MFNVSGLNPEVSMVTNVPGYQNKNFTFLGDEGNPISIERIQPKDYTLSVNARLVHWTKPVAYVATLSVLAGSTDDTFLRHILLLETPKAGVGVDYEANIISMVYKAGSCDSPTQFVAGVENLLPDQAKEMLHADGGTFLRGFILDGEEGPSIGSDGKKQTKSYTMVFEDFIPASF